MIDIPSYDHWHQTEQPSLFEYRLFPVRIRIYKDYIQILEPVSWHLYHLESGAFLANIDRLANRSWHDAIQDYK